MSGEDTNILKKRYCRESFDTGEQIAIDKSQIAPAHSDFKKRPRIDNKFNSKASSKEEESRENDENAVDYDQPSLDLKQTDRFQRTPVKA